MKKGAVAMLILLAMMLGGCADLYDGSYSTVMPHMRPVAPAPQQMMSARNRLQLLDIIQTLIESGKPDGVISVEGYDPQLLEQDMQGICGTIKKSHPVSAYALDQLTYETGKKDGGAVLSVNIRYIRNNTEILSVRSVADMDSASNQIRNAVARCDATLVKEIGKYAKSGEENHMYFIGVDGEPAAIRALEQGYIDGDMCQPIMAAAKDCINAAIILADGGTLDNTVNRMGGETITQANFEQIGYTAYGYADRMEYDFDN